jgi:hypothetical protein
MITLKIKHGQAYRKHDAAQLLAAWVDSKKDALLFGFSVTAFFAFYLLTEMVCAFLGFGYIG